MSGTWHTFLHNWTALIRFTFSPVYLFCLNGQWKPSGYTTKQWWGCSDLDSGSFGVCSQNNAEQRYGACLRCLLSASICLNNINELDSIHFLYLWKLMSNQSEERPESLMTHQDIDLLVLIQPQRKDWMLNSTSPLLLNIDTALLFEYTSINLSQLFHIMKSIPQLLWWEVWVNLQKSSNTKLSKSPLCSPTGLFVLWLQVSGMKGPLRLLSLAVCYLRGPWPMWSYQLPASVFYAPQEHSGPGEVCMLGLG